MNWIGTSWGAFAGMVGGCVLGAWLFVGGVAHFWLIGLLAGVGAAIVAVRKSGMMGLIVGTVALWTSAAAECVTRGNPILQGLVQFHETLTWPRLFSLLLCAALAIALGGQSWFPTFAEGASPERG